MSTLSNFVAAMIVLLSFSITALSQDNQNIIYQSPKKGARFVRPEQVLSFRTSESMNGESLRKSRVIITGSKSGEISGEWSSTDEPETWNYIPDQSYKYGETIRVSLPDGLLSSDGKGSKPLSFSFKVMNKESAALIAPYDIDNQYSKSSEGTSAPRTSSKIYQNRDTPSAFPPHQFTVYQKPAPGYIFANVFTPWDKNYKNFITIWDNYGELIFYREFRGRVTDLKLLPDGKLAFWRNHLEENIDAYFLMDSEFSYTDTLLMSNGYEVDHHEMRQMDNGHYLLMAYDLQLVNMSEIVPNGDPNATVIGLVIQEVDADGNVYFQWRSWDHFEITDAIDESVDLTASTIDYVHGNALHVDHDGGLLLSSRHMDEVTKIDMESGDIIWRMGVNSENNQFNILNDTIGFSHQHDVRILDNGNMTIYDNGNFHEPRISRALEYTLNQENLTAELVWNYTPDEYLWGYATGSHQRLENGNSIICWGYSGGNLAISEVKPDSTKTLDVTYESDMRHYRAYKYEWKGSALVAENEDLVFDETPYDTYKDKKVSIANNLDTAISLQEYNKRHELSNFIVVNDFPVKIQPGDSKDIIIRFSPDTIESYSDVFTFYTEGYTHEPDVADLSQRIAVQVKIKGEGAEPQSIMEREAKQMALFPNPAFDIIKLDVDGDWNYEVSDTQGNTVLEGDIGRKANEIQLQSLRTGIYYIIIWNNDEKKYGRFIKK